MSATRSSNAEEYRATGYGLRATADCQLVDQSLPEQLTRLAGQLGHRRQPVDHPTEGRLSTRCCRSRTAALGMRITATWWLAEAKLVSGLQSAAATKDAEIQGLKAKLGAIEVAQKLAVTVAVSAVERERDEMKSGLERAVLEKQVAEKSLKDRYETQIKDRDDTIERLREMKTRLSTKMIGETLEQHCETEFNRIRATAFPRAYFEKDNDARTGSKGDYIFRDSDESDTEIVSIMFEMKNESDRTATKSKNEDFLKELDKDRTEKGCEYAVLVSLLDLDPRGR